MTGSKVAYNMLTSALFGPLKFGTKILMEPDKRTRNAALLLVSLTGCGFLGDLAESMGDTGEVGTVTNVDVSGHLLTDSNVKNTNMESIASEYDSTALANAIVLRIKNSLTMEEQNQLLTGLKELVEYGQVQTINQNLLNEIHPETNVPFKMNEGYLSLLGNVWGVFPVFDSVYEIELNKTQYLLNDQQHFSIANKTLLNSLINKEATPNELGLNSQSLGNLIEGQTPEGFVWHHHEEPGVLQLVDREVHANTAHTGGRELWGGGKNSR